MINGRFPVKADDINAMEIDNEEYLYDNIDLLWMIYHTKKIDKDVRKAAKHKYNEFVTETHKRKGRILFKLL